MVPRLPLKALLCWLATAGGAGTGVKADPHLRPVSQTTESCPRCDMIFSMLDTASSGERVQHIEMVERGEPKSGTTFMYHWAHGALVHTCNFLNDWFGGGSCLVQTGQSRGLFHTPEEVYLTFNPRLGGDDAKCACDGVDRVEISVTDENKHTLPVARNCALQHSPGIAKHDVGCLSADGGAAESFLDIWLCMKRAACEIKDDRHQFAVMRDPRAAAVSTFFHEKKFPKSKLPGSVGGDIHTLDEFALAIAPVLCQWVTVRYFLFSVILESSSTLFWYSEAFHDAHKWHYEWMAAVGVHLPQPVIEAMADAALREKFQFDTSGKNDHPGVLPSEEVEHTRKETHAPTWQELLRPETLVALDVIANTWLPPEVLVKLGVPE